MSILSDFLKSERQYPILYGLAAGLYPVLFYFSNNYSLINSVSHFWYFLIVFLLIPMVGFYVANQVFKLPKLQKWKKYVLPFLGVFVFLFLLKMCLFGGLQKKIIVLIIVVSGLTSYFLNKHFKKLLVFQLLLAATGLYTASNTLISQMNFTDQWQHLDDGILEVDLKLTPNFYLIQPDGYVNFSELGRGYYQFPDSTMKNFLREKGFVNYPNFRSNYASTLSTNSSLFSMAHHYYNKGFSFSEALNARNVIMGNNNVLKILKRNGYTTHFISEHSYLMLNRPKIAYDDCNFSLKEIGYMSRGFGHLKNVMDSLVPQMQRMEDTPNFFFIEFFNPGHIEGRKENSEGAEQERALWLESLERGNVKLEELVTTIMEYDDDPMIVIMGDHGGFVGFNCTNEIYQKTQDRDLIYSIYSSQLSIKWPKGFIPKHQEAIKTPVNLFRILFSELSGEEKYLDTLQRNESYVIISQGAPKGVYQYIDEEGNVVFKKK